MFISNKKGDTKDRKLNCLGHQLAQGRAHFFLFFDELRRLTVRPPAQPKENTARNNATHQGHDRERDISQTDRHLVEFFNDQVQQPQCIDCRNRDQHVSP